MSELEVKASKRFFNWKGKTLWNSLSNNTFCQGTGVKHRCYNINFPFHFFKMIFSCIILPVLQEKNVQEKVERKFSFLVKRFHLMFNMYFFERTDWQKRMQTAEMNRFRLKQTGMKLQESCLPACHSWRCFVISCFQVWIIFPFTLFRVFLTVARVRVSCNFTMISGE